MPTVPRYQTSFAPVYRLMRLTDMPGSSGLLSVHPVAASPIAAALSGMGRQMRKSADTYADILLDRKRKEQPKPDDKGKKEGEKPKPKAPEGKDPGGGAGQKPEEKEEKPEGKKQARGIDDTVHTYARALLDHQEKQESLLTIDTANRVSKEAEKKQEELIQGFRGSEAQGITQRAAQWFDSYIQGMMEELPSNESRLALDQFASLIGGDLIGAISVHEAKETDKYRHSVLSGAFNTTKSALAGLALAGDALAADTRINVCLGQAQAVYGGRLPEEKLLDLQKRLRISFISAQAIFNPEAAEKSRGVFSASLDPDELSRIEEAISDGRRFQAVNGALARVVMEQPDEKSARAWADSSDSGVSPEDRPLFKDMASAYFRTREREEKALNRKLSESTHLGYADLLAQGRLTVFSLAGEHPDPGQQRAWFKALSGDKPETDPEVLALVLTGLYSDRKYKPEALVEKINNGLSPANGRALLAEHFAARDPDRSDEQAHDFFWTAQAVEMFDKAVEESWFGLSADEVRRTQARWFIDGKGQAGRDRYLAARQTLLAARK